MSCPGARRLVELEGLTKKRFFLEGKSETHLDHFVVLSEGKLADLAPPAPVGESAETMLQLVEVDRYDSAAAVGKLDGLDIVVADAASLVGKRVKVRVERVLDGRAYGVLMRKTKDTPEPLTAEGEAEKPTRKPPARKGATPAKDEPEASEVEELVAADEPEAEVAAGEPETGSEETADAGETPAPKKKTRRGSRGGRNRKKKPATAEGAAAAETAPEAAGAADSSGEPTEPARAVTIHVPDEGFGREGEAELPPQQQPGPEAEPEAADEPTTAEGEEAPKPKKKTRRGSRGGRNRKKKPAAATNGAEAAAAEEAEPAPAEAEETPQAEEPSTNGDFEYVPMSEWADEIESNR